MLFVHAVKTFEFQFFNRVRTYDMSKRTTGDRFRVRRHHLLGLQFRLRRLHRSDLLLRL
jgi:hypothetical protein